MDTNNNSSSNRYLSGLKTAGKIALATTFPPIGFPILFGGKDEKKVIYEIVVGTVFSFLSNTSSAVISRKHPKQLYSSPLVVSNDIGVYDQYTGREAIGLFLGSFVSNLTLPLLADPITTIGDKGEIAIRGHPIRYNEKTKKYESAFDPSYIFNISPDRKQTDTSLTVARKKLQDLVSDGGILNAKQAESHLGTVEARYNEIEGVVNSVIESMNRDLEALATKVGGY